jgi:hypothetical protein
MVCTPALTGEIRVKEKAEKAESAAYVTLPQAYQPDAAPLAIALTITFPRLA